MNRLKIFSTILISILVIIIVSSYIPVQAMVIGKDGSITVDSASDMFSIPNLYCVEHGQRLTGEYGSIEFNIKASIHIRGKKLTLKKWNHSNCTKSGCTCSNYNGGNGTAHYTQTFDGYNNASTKIKVDADGTTRTIGGLTTMANKIAAIFFTADLVRWCNK